MGKHKAGEKPSMCVKDVAQQQCFLLSSVLQGPAPVMSASPVVCRDLDIALSPGRVNVSVAKSRVSASKVCMKLLILRATEVRRCFI